VSEPPIPQLDLRRQLEELSSEIRSAQARVLASGRFILSDEVMAFEQEFAAYCGARHAVGVASGTDALELALRAVGIGPGDEVVTVAHTFIATPLAILATGAMPVFADVREEDGLIDPQHVARLITPKTQALLPVHLYGRCADMTSLARLAAEHGLRIIEDAAQAHGALSGECVAGAAGDAGCFSFYPSKNLGALGDAGAVVTNDAAIAERLLLLRNYGEDHRYHHLVPGRNSRLDELQAAVLRVKLPLLDGYNAARRRIAARYREAVAGTDLRLVEFDLERDVVHQAVLCSTERDALTGHLSAAGVGTLIHYPVPCHLQPALSGTHGTVRLPVTEQLAGEVLSLPMYPELDESQVERVCVALQSWTGG
jgi:dTDP-3-amino-3,4,6-trideoxy-alpha-D-glucose transaminase